ncbi:PilZ domain-containing protein [Methylobacterium sp. WL12]|nr:PilZ domain-containing protein [Methylobacterium sp. WL12]
MSEPQLPRDEKAEISWIAVIRLADGIDRPCTVTDVSYSAMKIRVQNELDLPDVFVLKIVGRSLIFQVRKVWRGEHSVVAVVEKIAKLPPQPAVSTETKSAIPDADRRTRLDTRRQTGSFS